MYAIRLRCQLALRRRSTVRICSNGSSRAFSRTNPLLRSGLPVFLEPSSSELSLLLATVNSRILLPAYLTKEQEKLVYDKENKARLETDPVDITLGSVTLPLQYIDRNLGPDRWEKLKGIIKNSKTSNDWENVLRVLEGYENAGVRFKPIWRVYVVRHIMMAGNLHLVLKALQRPKATGIRLSDPQLLAQVLRGLHELAANADWAEEETSQALRWTRQVIELMDDEEHCGGRSRDEEAEKRSDWRGDPAVVALPTELVATLADRYGGDKEEVKKLASRLVNACKQNDFTKELDQLSQDAHRTASDFKGPFYQMLTATLHSYKMSRLMVILNALKTSKKVLGADMPLADEAQSFEHKTAHVLAEGIKFVNEIRMRDGEKMENSLIDQITESANKFQR